VVNGIPLVFVEETYYPPDDPEEDYCPDFADESSVDETRMTFRELVRAIRHGGYSNPSAFPIAVPGDNHWLATDSEMDIHDGSIVQRSVHLSYLATPRETRYWAKAWRAAGVVFNWEDRK
jgi:hypothetical protein